jgi:hypothetical protein
MAEQELIRLTIDGLVDEYRSAGVKEEFSSREAWIQNSDAVAAALGGLRKSGDLEQFSRDLSALPNPPGWFKQGAHRTFLGTLADRADSPQASDIVADAFSVPTDDADAARRIEALIELAEGVERLYPGPGFAPLAVSIMWSFVDPDNWPWLSAEAEPTLHILRLLPRYMDGSERYLAYRELVLESSAPPPETVHALVRASDKGSHALSEGIYHRLRANADLLEVWYTDEAYPSDEEAARAGRNIEATLGEFDLFAKGMNEPIAERLVRDLVTSKTDPRVGYDLHLPSRADGYAIFTI